MVSRIVVHFLRYLLGCSASDIESTGTRSYGGGRDDSHVNFSKSLPSRNSRGDASRLANGDSTRSPSRQHSISGILSAPWLRSL